MRDLALWRSVDELVRRAPRSSDLRYHGLELLALRRQREASAPRSPEAVALERTAAATSLIAPLVLERVLASVDRPVVLMKGPEAAAWWANPLTRPYRDIDLLVEDSERAWRRLRKAGFVPTGDPELYEGIHHLRPLVWPGLPLVVEVHHQPKWIDGISPPTAELLETAVRSATGIPGLLALEPARHAIALAVHAWAHGPLGRLGRLVDVAALSQGADRRLLSSIAASWHVERLWNVTSVAVDSLFHGGRRPLVGHIWARYLWSARERTVLERHLQQWLAPFSALPPGAAARATRRQVAHQFALDEGETRVEMLKRSGRAATHLFQRQSDHDSQTTASKTGEGQ